MNQHKDHQTKIKFIKYSSLGLGLFLLLTTLVSSIYSIDSSKDENDVKDTKQKLPKDCSLTVKNPVFSGVTNTKSPYKILADTMIKDKSNNYILESISGECNTENGQIIVKSGKATLDEQEKHIMLKDDVIINFQGANLKTGQVNFNINTQDINSDVPVIVEFSNSYIKADKLESEDYSEVIRLRGNVESVLNLNDFNK